MTHPEVAWLYKYEMDPASIVEDTELTRFRPQTDGQMNSRMAGPMDNVKPVLRIPSVLLPSWGMRRHMRYLVNSQFFLSSWQMTVAWVVTGQTGRISLTHCFSGDLP